MNLKEIQTLIKFISTSKVDEVAIEQKDFKIKIRRNTNVSTKTVAVAAPQSYVEEHSPSAPENVPTSPAANEIASNYQEIKSPMIGTFYRRASPDKPSFVEVGDMVEKGQVICIIEAMKLFNEIESEVSGKIVKALIDDSQPVEYDQPLFLVEPV
jgi:acetyl-CoA carboxylase biotin carboxyl carrier protein